MSQNRQFDINTKDCPVCEQTFVPEDTPDASKIDGVWLCSEPCVKQASELDRQQAKERDKFSVFYDPSTGMLTVEDGADRATQQTVSGLVSKARTKLQNEYGNNWRERCLRNGHKKEEVAQVVASHEGYLHGVFVT